MNAKNELLKEIKNKAKIKCALIKNEYGYEENEVKIIVLKINYSEKEYEKFFEELDFNYDSGYGGQELFGTVWMEDGTWIERGEYDGSEWWNYKSLPTIPNECL
jgi:hypothetical protein